MRHCKKHSVPVSKLEQAAVILRRGGVVAHATEGVWGLACDPRSDAAIQKVLEIKQREKEKGLILIGGTLEYFQNELFEVKSDNSREIVDSWPGHHTWILPNACDYSDWVTGGRDSVACRVPDHKQARELSLKFGAPLVSTSANLSGQAELTSEQAVRETFEGILDFILPGVIGNADGPSRIHFLDGSMLRGAVE